jgi:nucleoside-diphosphate-sugar epimerase
MAETMCFSFYKEYEVPIKIARIAHTYSPTMNIDSDPRVFSSFVKNIIEKKNIVMYSDGKSKRCFTYITDAVAAYFKILLEGKSGEAYNVCNTEEFYSIRELAEMLVGLYPEYHLDVEYKQRSSSESYTENNLQSVKSFITDNGKLKGLGFDFKVTVKDGFKRVISFLQE